MDFELSEDQRAFADTARAFAQTELAPHAAHWDAEAIFPREAIAKAGELGFCGLYAPENACGLALPRLDATGVNSLVRPWLCAWWRVRRWRKTWQPMCSQPARRRWPWR